MVVLYMGAAWLVLQVVDLLIDRGPLPEPLGPLTLTLLVIGFPIALVLSWFYEVTPEGLILDEDVESGAAVKPAGRVLDFIIIAVLAAAVLMFAWDKWWTAPPLQGTVAVLPFTAISSSEDDGYFADGLTEEILNSLAQLPELQVTARTSSFFFKGKDIPLPEVANLLNVAHIVGGSVRRDGQRLRITSQLIRAEDGFHLWSQTYDRSLEDVFYVQQDIAEKVAEALDVVLDDEARERMHAMQINDVEAFIDYQKGIEYYELAHGPELHMIEGLAIANTYFDNAIEAQPNLSAARVLKADRAAHVLHMLIQIETPDISEVKTQAETLQTELDLAWRASLNGNQRDILDLERRLAGDDWRDLSALIQRAMQPGDCPTINISAYIVSLGFADELAAKFEESLACNPMDAYVIFALARTYVQAGRPDEALELLENAEARGVQSKLFNNARVDALVVAGRFDDPALKPLQSEYMMRHLTQGNVGAARQMMRHLIQGNQADARQIAEQIWSSPETDVVSSLEIAEMVGDRERANEFAARIDKYPGSAWVLLESSVDYMIWARVGIAKGYRNGILFDLEATPNFMARIEESGLPWPP